MEGREDMTNVDRLRDPEWPRHNADVLAQPWATESIHENFDDIEYALDAVRERLAHAYSDPYDAALGPRLRRIHELAAAVAPDVVTAHTDYTARHARMPRWWRLLRRLHDGA